MSDSVLKPFVCHLPVELIKAENADDDDLTSWQIRGIASTGDVDLQGEIVDQEGLDISTLKAGRGLLNNDHSNKPEDILGQIEDAEFVKVDGQKVLMIKGYLFKHQMRAQAYYNIMKSLKKGAAPRVHMSIEGKILERGDKNQSWIKKAKIDRVALTLSPVNPFTVAELAKSLLMPEPTSSESTTAEIEKAMDAGAAGEKAPSELSGSEALTNESLDPSLKVVTYQKLKKDKKLSEQVLKSIVATLEEHYPQIDPLELTRLVCTSFENKMKELIDV